MKYIVGGCVAVIAISVAAIAFAMIAAVVIVGAVVAGGYIGVKRGYALYVAHQSKPRALPPGPPPWHRGRDVD